MRLLIVTQKVDQEDDILGFFHRWIEEFAKHAENVTVICLYEGVHDLPENVSVYSLGKEHGVSRLTYVIRFYRYLTTFRKNYDTVFVHMNPEYLVLGGLLWRLMGKRIALWYTHRAVNLKLRIAHAFAHRVFSASGYSFTLPSSKLAVVGHGIDVARFACDESERSSVSVFTVVCVGDIRPIKSQHVLVKAAALLKETWDRDFKIIFIGDAAPEYAWYAREVRELVEQLGVGDVVEFAGSIPNVVMREHYCRADASVNLTPDGGVDKVVLESMAAGVPAFSSNHAFTTHFGDYADMLVFRHNDHKDLAEHLTCLADYDEKEELTTFLQKTARERFSVEALVSTLVSKIA